MPYLFLSDSDSESIDPTPSDKADCKVEQQSGEKTHKKLKGTDKPLSVSRVNQIISNAILTSLPTSISVAGEVTGLSRSGHYYFSLSDHSSESQVRAIIWRSQLSQIESFDNGDRVIVKCRLSHYSKQGTYNLQISSLTKQDDEEGELKKRIQMTRKKAEQRGYFNLPKKNIPYLPQTIAVVTSLKGDALQDVLNYLRKNSLVRKVIVYDTKVQGQYSVASLVENIHKCGQNQVVECVLVTRGGGSQQDLMSYNELPVLEAICNCPLPLLTGIGHTMDTSLADLVADQKAITPTDLARIVSGETRKEILSRLSRYREMLTAQYQNAIEKGRIEVHQRREKMNRLNVQNCLDNYILQLRVLRNTLLITLEKHLSRLRSESMGRDSRLEKDIAQLKQYFQKLRGGLNHTLRIHCNKCRTVIREKQSQLESLTTDPFTNNISVVTDLQGGPLQLSKIANKKRLTVQVIIEGEIYQATLSLKK